MFQAKAYAATPFTFASMQVEDMTTSAVGVKILVVGKPATSTTAANVVVTFAAGYTVAAGAGAVTVSTSGMPATYNGASLVAWPSIANGTAATQVVTFPTTGGSALSTSTVYGFYITAGITNPSSPGQYINTIAVTGGDSTQVATAAVASDQIIVSAVVPPIFTFALGGTTDSFTGNLSPASVVLTTGQTATIGTNGSQGWTTSVKSANQALHSPTTGSANNIPSVAAGALRALSAGTPAYALSLSSTHAAGSGTITVAPSYAGDATHGGALTSGYTVVATSDGTASSDVLTLKELAAISSVTGAASDYSDTLTVIAASNY